MNRISSSPLDYDPPSEADFNKISRVVTEAKRSLEPLIKELEEIKNRNVVLVFDLSTRKIGIVVPTRVTEIKTQLNDLRTQFQDDTKKCGAKFTHLLSPIHRLFKEKIHFCNSYSHTFPLSKI